MSRKIHLVDAYGPDGGHRGLVHACASPEIARSRVERLREIDDRRAVMDEARAEATRAFQATHPRPETSVSGDTFAEQAPSRAGGEDAASFKARMRGWKDRRDRHARTARGPIAAWSEALLAAVEGTLIERHGMTSAQAFALPGSPGTRYVVSSMDLDEV